METPKAPETRRGETTFIGPSMVIKGELSCGEDLYIDGQVEGTIDPKGNRLTVGPNGRVKASVNARAVGDISTQRISIDEGAYFKGRVNIQKEAPKKEEVHAAAS